MVGSGVTPRHSSKRGRGRSAALPRTPAGTLEQRAKEEGGSKSCGRAAGAPRTATQVHRSAEGSRRADGGAGRPPASLPRHRRDPQGGEAPPPYCRSRERGEPPVPGPPLPAPEPSRRFAGARGAQGQRDELTAAAVLTCARRSGTAEPRGAGSARAPPGLSLPLPAPRVSNAPSPGDRPPPRAPWSARSPAPLTRRHRGQPMGTAAGGATHWLGRLSLSSAAAINGPVSQSLPQRLQWESGAGVVSWSAAFGGGFPSFFGAAFEDLWLQESPRKGLAAPALACWLPPGEVRSELGSGLSPWPSTWVFLHLPVSATQAMLAHHFREDTVMNFTVGFIPC